VVRCVVTGATARNRKTGAPGRPRDGERTRLAIWDAARELFATRGYAGTSLRHIAMAVGIEVDLIRTASDQLLEQLEAVVDPDESAVERLRAVVEELARHHAVHRAQSLIGAVEMRELLPHHRRSALKQRARVEGLFKDLVAECVQTGYFPPDANVTVTANLLIGVSTSVAGWFDPAGALTPNGVAAMASRLVLPDRQAALD
jgi:AcrR family transcriptional regulator